MDPSMVTLSKKRTEANWHQYTASVNDTEHSGNTRAKIPRRRRRSAVEAPLQVRCCMFRTKRQ